MRRRGKLVFLLLLVLLVVLWFLDPWEWLGGRSKDREIGKNSERGEAPPETDPEPTPEPGFIVGAVTAGDGTPLPGASINLRAVGNAEFVAATDENGWYRANRSVESLVTEPRSVDVDFRGMHIGSVPYPDRETIVKRGVVIDFRGPKEVVLRGFVAVRDGDALPGARISVGEHSTTSGDRGKFSLTIPFDVLRSDPTPKLRVEADAHETHEQLFPFATHDDLAVFLEPK